MALFQKMHDGNSKFEKWLLWMVPVRIGISEQTMEAGAAKKTVIGMVTTQKMYSKTSNRDWSR